MAPPVISLDGQSEYIKSLYIDQKMPVYKIAEILTARLGTQITLRTLQRRLNQWGLKLHTRSEDTPELQKALRDSFFEGAARNDREIFDTLKAQNHTVSQRGVVQLRRKLVGPIRLPKQTSEAAAIPSTTGHKRAHSNVSTSQTLCKKTQPNSASTVAQGEGRETLDLTLRDMSTTDDDPLPTLDNIFNGPAAGYQDNADMTVSEGSTMQTRSITRALNEEQARKHKRKRGL
jgi:hypothetical protein